MKRALALVVAILMLLPFSSFFVSAEGLNTNGGFLSEKFKAENSYQYSDDEVVHAIVIADGKPASEYGDVGSKAATSRESKLKKQHSKIWAAMQSKDLEYNVVAEYTTLLNGFGVVTTYGDLKKMADISGVNNIYISNRYSVPEYTADDTTNTIGSAIAQGTYMVNDLGYYGEGMTIAVIDTGLNANHIAFGEYGLTKESISRDYISSLIEDGLICDGKFVSEKVLFAYDYADRDNDASDFEGHGTHVAGIAAGFDGESLTDYNFSGVAPAAQIVALKVFSDSDQYAYDDAIFKALEDAYYIGVDVINMSLGAFAGFTYDSDVDGYYNGIFQALEEAGIVVCCSCGNNGGMGCDKEYVFADYYDYGTIGDPSTYEGNTSVAAANNFLYSSETTYSSGNLPELSLSNSRGTIATYSSWGVTSALEFGPEITGIGSNVFSADASTKDCYISYSGTSMASPNVAGNFLLVLQYLKKTQDFDKPTRAAFAELMIKNSAILLNNGFDFFSPRQQGAGLVNAYNAINTYSIISNPTESLYDNPNFDSIKVKVKITNIDVSSHAYAVTPVLIGDRYSEYSSAIETINYLRPATFSSDDYIFDGETSFELDSMETKEFEYTIVMSDAIKDFINSAAIGGIFVDGYLLIQDETGNQCHKSFISFFGDWTEGSIIEEVDNYDFFATYYRYIDMGYSEDDAYNAAYEDLTLEVGNNYAYLYHSDTEAYAYLGSNWCTDEYFLNYSKKRFAFSPTRDGENNSYFNEIYVCPTLLRDAKQVIMTVTDKNSGEIINFDTQEYVRKSYFYFEDWMWYGNCSLEWFGTDVYDEALPDDAVVTIDVYAYLDYEGIPLLDTEDPADVAQYIKDNKLKSLWSFDVTIDSILPEYKYDYVEGNIVIDFSDNQYLQAVAFGKDGEQDYIVYECFYDDEPGHNHKIEIADYKVEPGIYTINAIDYAGNYIYDYVYIDEKFDVYYFDEETGFCENGNGFWCYDGVTASFEIDDEYSCIDVYFNCDNFNAYIDYPMEYVAQLATDLGYGINMWITGSCQDCVSFQPEAVALINEEADGNFIWVASDSSTCASVYFDPCGVDISEYPATIWMGGYHGLDKLYIYSREGLFGLIESTDTWYDEYNNVIYFSANGPTVFEFYNNQNIYNVAQSFADKAEFYAAMSEMYFGLTMAMTELNTQILVASNSSAIYAQEAASAAIEAQQLAELAQANAEEAASSAIAAQNEAERILGDINATKDEIDAANSSAISAKNAAETAKTAAETAKTAAETAKTAAEAARDRAEAAALRAEEAASSAIIANSSAIEAKEAAEKAQSEAEKAQADAEKAKAEAEDAKSSAIAAQVAAEKAKADADAAKAAADADKSDAEAAKTAAEAAKKAAETAKKAAETEKTAAEAAKKAAETEKSAAEAAKVAAEAAKVAAEAEKTAAESAKLAAEAEKKASETAKAEAEAAKKAAEDAKAAAEIAKSSAIDALNEISEKYDAFKEEQKKIAADVEKITEDYEQANALLEEAKAQAQSGCKSSVSALVVVAVLGVAYTFVRKKNDD